MFGNKEQRQKNRKKSQEVLETAKARGKEFGWMRSILYTLAFISAIGFMTFFIVIGGLMVMQGTLLYLLLPFAITLFFVFGHNTQLKKTPSFKVGLKVLSILFCFDLTATILYWMLVTENQFFEPKHINTSILIIEYFLINIYLFDVFEVFHKGYHNSIKQIKNATSNLYFSAYILLIVGSYLLINSLSLSETILNNICIATSTIIFFGVILLLVQIMKYKKDVTNMPTWLPISIFTVSVLFVSASASIIDTTGWQGLKDNLTVISLASGALSISFLIWSLFIVLPRVIEKVNKVQKG